MKDNRTILLLITIVMTLGIRAQKVIKNPQVDYSPSFMRVNEIRLYKDSTVMSIDLWDKPFWWISIGPGDYLVDAQTNRRYKFLHPVGVPMNERIYMPASGTIPCKMVFEALDKNTKVLNLGDMEKSPESTLIGIHLKSAPREKTPDYRGTITSSQMTREYYLSQPVNNNPWNLDMPRLWTEWHSDTAVVRTSIRHYLPLFKRRQVRALIYNNVSLEEKTIVAPISHDGTYEMKIPLDQPQVVFFDYPNDVVYLEPGDTLDMTTDAEMTNMVRPRTRAFRSNSKSGIINALHDTVMVRLGVPNAYFTDWNIRHVSKLGLDSIMALHDRLASCFLGVSDKSKLDGMPLTPEVKRYMVMNAQAEIISQMVYLWTAYENTGIRPYTKAGGTKWYNMDSTFQKPNVEQYYSPVLSPSAICFDTPQILSCFDNWEFFNKVEMSKLKDMLPKNQFMMQLIRTRDAIHKMRDVMQSSEENPHARKNADAMTQELSALMAEITYPQLSQTLMKDYRKMIQVTDLEVNPNYLSEKDHNLLDSLLVCHRGRVNYLHFFSPNIADNFIEHDAEMIEQLQGKPVRFFFIAPKRYEFDYYKASQWLNDKGITNASFNYVNDETWSKFCQLFHFSDIPHVVIIGKDGNVKYNGYYRDYHKLLNKYVNE